MKKLACLLVTGLLCSSTLFAAEGEILTKKECRKIYTETKEILVEWAIYFNLSKEEVLAKNQGELNQLKELCAKAVKEGKTKEEFQVIVDTEIDLNLDK